MEIPKIYLETTIFKFLFADDAPDLRDYTLQLFEEIGTGKFRPYTSEYVKGGLLRQNMKWMPCIIAVATIAKLDYIISLNFQHIVKHKTISETEYEETKDMTFEERRAYYNESTERFFASYGKVRALRKNGA